MKDKLERHINFFFVDKANDVFIVERVINYVDKSSSWILDILNNNEILFVDY